MQFGVDTVNKLLDIDESYKAPSKMLEIMLDDQKRPLLFKKFLAISTDLKFDWFHEYFEDEQAERKSKKQDFTPDSVATLLNKLVVDGEDDPGTYFEVAAGTGGILIKRWWNDCLNDPKGNPLYKKYPQLSIFTYDPRSYWYQVEEMSDKAIPFLIFNMAIRGMNGVIVQCDSLSRKAKDIYFIRNDTDNFLGFSEVHLLPHTDDFKKEFSISEWVDSFA